MGAPDTGMTGLIHIYCGDGKGKTTAGMGLCVRAAGYGYKVLVCQFMKDNRSSELGALQQIPQITVLPGPDQELFSFQMSPRQKEEKKRFFEQRLLRAFRQVPVRPFLREIWPDSGEIIKPAVQKVPPAARASAPIVPVGNPCCPFMAE